MAESPPVAAAHTAATAGARTELGGEKKKPELARAGLGNKTGADWLKFAYALQ